MALFPYCIALVIVGIGIHWSDTTFIFQKDERGPSPGVKGISNLLFYLERNPDPNAVCYTLNLDPGGKISDQEPINVFWFRYNKVPERRPLSLVQKKFAYGVKTRLVGEQQYEVKIVSFPERNLMLKRSNGKDFQVFANIAGKEAVLSNVYVKFTSASAAPPLVEYIELFGNCTVSGRKRSERIFIQK